ncbi:MAG: hypothetical protein HN380_05585 [Victivallales bacterium]|nr:hypothetical protein [Victivallales bacterium]
MIATPNDPATGIPPAGLDVTVTCDTPGAVIYYTLDGTDPTNASTPYPGTPVHIPEETGLTATKSVVFKATAYVDVNDSAVATATYTNFAEAEFSMKLDVAGAGDTSVPGLEELEFGFLTGATDNYDTGIDGDLVVRAAARDNPPVPQLPVADIRFITADSLLTQIDYRSRAQPKEWQLQAQLFPGQGGAPAEITLTWGHDAQAGFGLPPATVPYLWLYRKTETATQGVYESTPVVGGDLTTAGSITINRADWPAEPDDYDGNGNDLYRTFYIVYRNAGPLTTTIAPAAAITAGAQWAYRGTDTDAYSAWKDSGDSETVHAGEYEVKFKTLDVRAAAYYPPPNQIVTVTAEQTTTVTGTYLDTQSTAELAPASDKYDPEGGTVDVNCTFTYSPDVTLTSLTWEFPAGTPPADWTITALSGTDGAAGVVQGDNRTIVFSDARSVPASNPIEFTVTFTYPDQGETPPDITFDATVTAVTNAGTLTPDVAPQAITPQTATLDVDGDGAFTSDDVVFVSRYQTLKVLAGLDRATVVLLLVPSTMSPVSDAGTIYDTIEELESDLNVDGDGAFTSDDVVFVSRYQTLKVLAGLDRATVVLLLVPSTMSPVSDAGTIYDSISAIDPTEP